MEEVVVVAVLSCDPPRLPSSASAHLLGTLTAAWVDSREPFAPTSTPRTPPARPRSVVVRAVPATIIIRSTTVETTRLALRPRLPHQLAAVEAVAVEAEAVRAIAAGRGWRT